MSSEINWHDLKSRDFERWKYELYGETEKLLKSSDRVELASYNDIGYYHNFKGPDFYAKAKETWGRKPGAISKRICSGWYPGIWTVMFDQVNSHSPPERPHAVRITFREGFSVYDRQNQVHKEMAGYWNPDQRENPWEDVSDVWGWNFARKMELHQYPSHKSFYEENKIGAVIGYSDFISPVIILEEAVDKVEFLE